MTEQRPDTDERNEPGGTPSPGPHDLAARPQQPGGDRDGGDGPATVPGAYESTEADQERGKAVKPGN